MTEAARNEYLPDEVLPPGDTLADVLEAAGLSQTDLALRMGRPKKTIHEILHGKAAITAETAVQLERVLGLPSEFWSNLQANYDRCRSLDEEGVRLAAQKPWLDLFPYAVMAKRGWVPVTSGTVPRVRALLSFFGVASPEQWKEVCAAQTVSFRKSPAFDANVAALTAWLRRGQQDATRIECMSYSASRFRETLAQVRGLSQEKDPGVFVPALQRACAVAGVAVVFVPQINGCRASGATLWVSSEKAVIQLSLRYKTNDHLWFTFFHEAAHVLLHPKKAVFIEQVNDGHDGEQEAQANEFAATTLIAPSAYARFLMSSEPLSKARIGAFATAQGIAPGIVVGRLQHDGHLPRSHCNDLKVSYEWKA